MYIGREANFYPSIDSLLLSPNILVFEKAGHYVSATEATPS
jgi:hypothetical protein